MERYHIALATLLVCVMILLIIYFTGGSSTEAEADSSYPDSYEIEYVDTVVSDGRLLFKEVSESTLKEFDAITRITVFTNYDSWYTSIAIRCPECKVNPKYTERAEYHIGSIDDTTGELTPTAEIGGLMKKSVKYALLLRNLKNVDNDEFDKMILNSGIHSYWSAEDLREWEDVICRESVSMGYNCKNVLAA